MLREAVHEVTTVLQAVKICVTISDSTNRLEMNSHMYICLYVCVYIYICGAIPAGTTLQSDGKKRDV